MHITSNIPESYYNNVNDYEILELVLHSES